MTRLTPAQRAWLVLFCVPCAFLAAFSIAATCVVAAVIGGRSMPTSFIAWRRESRERFRCQQDCSHYRMDPYGEPCPDCGTDPLSDKF